MHPRLQCFFQHRVCGSRGLALGFVPPRGTSHFPPWSTLPWPHPARPWPSSTPPHLALPPAGVWLLARCADLQGLEYDVRRYGLCLLALCGLGLMFRWALHSAAHSSPQQPAATRSSPQRLPIPLTCCIMHMASRAGSWLAS